METRANVTSPQTEQHQMSDFLWNLILTVAAAGASGAAGALTTMLVKALHRRWRGRR